LTSLQVPPARTTSKSSGYGTGLVTAYSDTRYCNSDSGAMFAGTAPNLGWGTVPAMPATPDKGEGSKGLRPMIAFDTVPQRVNE